MIKYLAALFTIGQVCSNVDEDCINGSKKSDDIYCLESYDPFCGCNTEEYPNDYKNIDYLIIGSWLGDMIDKNKHKSEQSLMIIFRENFFLSYINPPRVFHEDLYKDGIIRNNNFQHLQTIRGYEPSIFIYENKNRLIRN